MDEERGHYTSALERYEKALSISQYQDNQTGVATCLRHMGSVRQQLGQLDEAEAHLEQALAMLRKQGGDDKPEIIEATNLLGAVLEDQGRSAEALKLYRDALRLAESLNLRPARAESLRRMGSAYAVQGDFGAAVERYLQAIDLSKEIDDTVALSELYGDIGDIYLEQGNLDEAIGVFKEALRLDSTHSDELGMAVAYRRLGSAYQLKGDHGQALDSYRDSKRLLEGLDDDGERAVLNVVWGVLFEDQGQYRTSLEHYGQALSTNEQQQNHVGVAICLRHMGSAYLQLGEIDKADASLVEALRLLDQHGGQGKPEVIATTSTLSYVRLAQRRVAEARTLAGEAHRAAETMQHRPAIAACLRARGAVERAQPNLTRAADHLNEALSIAKTLGNEVLRAELLDDIADIYEQDGQLEEALKAYNDGLKRARRLDRYALTTDILLGLARCHRQLGRVDVARDLIDEATEAIEQHDASAVIKAHLGLERARLAELAGREEFAIDEYEKALETFSAVGEALPALECRQLLLLAYSRRGDFAHAAVHLTAALADQDPGALWAGVALSRFDPAIAHAAADAMASGHYASAVNEAFKVVELRLLRLMSDATRDSPVRNVVGEWFTPQRRGIAPFRDAQDLEGFKYFAIGAFGAGRNRHTHQDISASIHRHMGLVRPVASLD